MINYKYKKYKNKYNKLKNIIGGFTLSNDSSKILGMATDDEDFLYQNIKCIL